jgi:zinc finger protein 830
LQQPLYSIPYRSVQYTKKHKKTNHYGNYRSRRLKPNNQLNWITIDPRPNNKRRDGDRKKTRNLKGEGMADVRALLKAKRQEVRITHPYAAYGANGALRCTACGAAIKFASAWEGHLGSKAHRVAVANLRAKEEATAATAAVSLSVSKRKAEDGEGEQEQVAMATGKGKKRQRTEERDFEEPDERGTSTDTTGTGAAFPANFFSDPARAPPTSGGQDDDDDDDVQMDHVHDHDAAKAKTATGAPPPKSQFDMEWDAFERDIQQKPSRPVPPVGANEESAADAADPHETFTRATIAAEPELVESRFEEGLPVDGAGVQEGTTTTGAEEGGRKVSEEELERRRKERDERELIMDRLVEEERAQEDAYGRLALLKNRVQMLKQKRELAKAKKGKMET